MRSSNYDRLYKKAKKIIGDYTPLKNDCGELCGGICCKGDKETGMILFPFEQTNFAVKEKNGVRLAVCDGSCKRQERPLACMLFPFFPCIDQGGKIDVKEDYRGINICPMISQRDKIRFKRGFLRRVKKVGRLLKEDELCREFILSVSDEIGKIQAISGENG